MVGKIFHRLRPLLCSQSTFILRVAPLRKQDKERNKSYFPPPGYGVPAGKKTQFKHSPKKSLMLLSMVFI